MGEDRPSLPQFPKRSNFREDSGCPCFGHMPTSEPITVARGVEYSGHSGPHAHLSWGAESCVWQPQRDGMGQEEVGTHRKRCWVNNSCSLPLLCKLMGLSSQDEWSVHFCILTPNPSSLLLTHLCSKPLCPTQLEKSKWLAFTFF